MKNPQIEAVSILLQETMPEKFIITKTLKGNALTASERIVENKKPKEENKEIWTTKNG